MKIELSLAPTLQQPGPLKMELTRASELLVQRFLDKANREARHRIHHVHLVRAL